MNEKQQRNYDLDIRYSILTAKELHSNTITALLAARAAHTQQLIDNAA